jgi:transcriptional regulator with XRE-family HTH domain
MLTKHLKAWRKSAGHTLETAAEALGVAHTTVGKWENGVTQMPLDRLDDLARLYRAQHPWELLFPPDDREHAPKLADAHAILRALPPDQAAAWLLIGRTMAGLPSAPPPDTSKQD